MLFEGTILMMSGSCVVEKGIKLGTFKQHLICGTKKPVFKLYKIF